MITLPILAGFSEVQAVFDSFAETEYGNKNTSDFPTDIKNIRIIYAGYRYETYEGWAHVVYRNLDNGKLYIVEGSHCSCNGLEGQWSPTETTPEAIRLMFEGGWPSSAEGAERDALKQVIEELDSPGAAQAQIHDLETDVAILEGKVKELQSEEARALRERRRVLLAKKASLEAQIKLLSQS